MNVYSSAAAMHHLEGWQSAVAQNLSAGMQPGYKALQVSMEKPAAGTGGKQLPLVSHETRDFAQGSIQRTGRALDVAFAEEGFIVAEDPANQPILLRNGSLHINADGRLTTASGWEIDGRDGPIQTIANAEDPHIDESGEVWQGDVSIGRIRAVAVDNPAGLVFDGAGWRLPADGSVQVAELADPELRPGFLEEANISPLTAMVTLIQITRAFEANQKALHATDEAVERTIRALA